MKQYTLTLNEKQAQVVSTALNLFSRMHMGQFYTLTEVIPGLAYSKIRERVMPLLKQAGKDYTGLPACASFGIYSREISDQARQAYDIHQVIRHRLYWDRTPVRPPFTPVDGDEPMKSSFEEELPTIQLVEGTEKL